jgi:hypothetical protein
MLKVWNGLLFATGGTLYIVLCIGYGYLAITTEFIRTTKLMYFHYVFWCMAFPGPLILIVTGFFLGLSLKGVVPGGLALAALVINLFPYGLLAWLIPRAGLRCRVELFHCAAAHSSPHQDGQIRWTL